MKRKGKRRMRRYVIINKKLQKVDIGNLRLELKSLNGGAA